MTSTIELTDSRVMPTYRRKPVEFVRGQGMYLFDNEGKRFLDFVAGVAVTALGHAHPQISEAMSKQSAELVHTSNLYYTRPMAELAMRLTDLLGWSDGRVFFANSGAEANECAMKLVRRWAKERFGPDRYELIAALGSFHGRTFETLAATGQPAKWEPFSPLPPGFRHVPFDDAAALEAAVDDSVSGVLLEPILGEGGVVVPKDDYLPTVRRICDDNGLALIMDEVQTGLGRTGRMFAFERQGAVPDVITLAKALGNGLPIGACAARGELAGAFSPGDHGTTMGGGPVVCSVALTVLDVIEKESLVENAAQVGSHLRAGLEELKRNHTVISEIRGLGLLLGIDLEQEVAAQVVSAAFEEGLLVNDVTPRVIRLCPPLIVSESECDAAVETLDRVFSAVEGQM